MKPLLITFSFFSFFISYAQVGIGTASPDPSSILDIESFNSGVRFPRLTDAQRNTISNPATGLLIFNTDDNSLQYNFGTPSTPNWVKIVSPIQSGSYNVGTAPVGWKYYNVTFDNPYLAIPSILLTFREGHGVDNSGSHTSTHFKVMDASTTGFTIGIYSTTRPTEDIFIDWLAIPRTQ